MYGSGPSSLKGKVAQGLRQSIASYASVCTEVSWGSRFEEKRVLQGSNTGASVTLDTIDVVTDIDEDYVWMETTSS